MVGRGRQVPPRKDARPGQPEPSQGAQSCPGVGEWAGAGGPSDGQGVSGGSEPAFRPGQNVDSAGELEGPWPGRPCGGHALRTRGLHSRRLRRGRGVMRLFSVPRPDTQGITHSHERPKLSTVALAAAGLTTTSETTVGPVNVRWCARPPGAPTVGSLPHVTETHVCKDSRAESHLRCTAQAAGVAAVGRPTCRDAGRCWRVPAGGYAAGRTVLLSACPSVNDTLAAGGPCHATSRRP